MGHRIQNSLYKLFEHKCVLEVCVHIHPIMIQIHPVIFLNPHFKIPLALSEWRSFVQAPPTIVDWQDRLNLDPLWVSWELSAASGAEEDKMSPIKWLKCFVVGSNNEYSSRQLLQTSEPLKTQKININFALKGMYRSPNYINPKGTESRFKETWTRTAWWRLSWFWQG